MKRLLTISGVVMLSIILQTCKKLSLPDLKTENVSEITQITATSGGEVTNNGGNEVTARGVCWDINQKPTVSSSKTTDSSGNGPFKSKITGLTANRTYYVRAYATNSEGVGYGNEVSFKTPLPFTMSGLVAYYPFNGNANDESGNGNNGVLLSGATITTDKNGVANSACSVNPGFVQIADNPSLKLSSYTLSVWFKAEGVNDHYNCLIGKNYVISYAVGFDFGGSLVCDTTGFQRTVRAYVANSGYFFNTSNINCGDWYHVVVTYNDATGDIILYLNGNLLEQGSVSPSSMGSSSDPLAIGKDGFYGDKFTGVVDEVSIFNRFLTQNEIAQLYSYY